MSANILFRAAAQGLDLKGKKGQYPSGPGNISCKESKGLTVNLSVITSRHPGFCTRAPPGPRAPTPEGPWRCLLPTDSGQPQDLGTSEPSSLPQASSAGESKWHLKFIKRTTWATVIFQHFNPDLPNSSQVSAFSSSLRTGHCERGSHLIRNHLQVPNCQNSCSFKL